MYTLLQQAPSTAASEWNAETFHQATALEYGLSHLYKAVANNDAIKVEDILCFLEPEECYTAMTMTGNSANGESALGCGIRQKDKAVMGVLERSTTKELWGRALKQEQDNRRERETIEKCIKDKKGPLLEAVEQNDYTAIGKILNGLGSSEQLGLITHNYGNGVGTVLHIAIYNCSGVYYPGEYRAKMEVLDTLIKGLDSSQIHQAITKKSLFNCIDSRGAVASIISPLSYAFELSKQGREYHSGKAMSEKLTPDDRASALSASLPSYSSPLYHGLLFHNLSGSQTIRAITPQCDTDNTLLHLIMMEVTPHTKCLLMDILEKIKDAPADEAFSFLNRKNKNGDTALDIARSRELIGALKEAGAIERTWTRYLDKTVGKLGLGH